jgi:hypothetical protein
MGNESAVIVPIPEVEPFVGPLRLQYDASARLGVPAHITLLYPFCAAEAADEAIPRLTEVFALIESFDFAFTEVRRFPATAYLHPDKAEAFVEMIRALSETWPDCKPYGGAFTSIVPHLTVADRVDGEILAAVEDSLRRHLPIACVAREAWLMTSDAAGMWSRKARFSLA